MKRWLPVIAGLVAMVVLTGAARCKPVPPKDWRGTIRLAQAGVALTRKYFVEFDPTCTWKGQEQNINGLDALIWDVGAHAGLAASVTWTTDFPVPPTSVTGQYFNSICMIHPTATFTAPRAGSAHRFRIPTKVKWLVVSPASLPISANVAVTLHSFGRKCR